VVRRQHLQRHGSILCRQRQQCRHNSGYAVDGSLDLIHALRFSSDDFFYNLGARSNADPATHPDGGPLDTWA
jgi:hypothetical protein